MDGCRGEAVWSRGEAVWMTVGVGLCGRSRGESLWLAVGVRL